MDIFESLFDISYLCVVIVLGIRLLMESGRDAKGFGSMAVLLGLGDAFHLLPRVIAHLSPGGFKAHEAALSWGQFVTSITMTLFYVLFYHYYRRRSGDRDPVKRAAIYGLAAIRLVLVLMPQNQWGQAPENNLFALYRNIPFAVMGVLLIIWSAKARRQPGLKHMSLFIVLSFAFYLPVVLWSRQFPPVGALMMPKTIAYLLIVVLGYRFFVKVFDARHILALSFSALIMGLAGGVFYREFTKYYAFQAVSHLGKLHVHTLVLGCLMLLVLYLIVRQMPAVDLVRLKRPLLIYLTGLTFTLVNMTVLGIYEVVGQNAAVISPAALGGASGLGHIILAAGLIWLFARLLRMAQKQPPAAAEHSGL